MTDTEQPSLTEFLLARIAEDDADACSANGLRVLDMPPVGSWGPLRVLAECEVKRRIVALHDSEGSHECTAGQAAGAGEDIYVTSDECPTLHALCLPYARHPDYRHEWAL